MLRNRTIAASPVRSASATWQVITGLVADTIATSAALSRSEAEQAMSVAASAGRMLIAGGHLDQHPLTLVAGLVHCRISTVSGTAALTAEENLNPVPGAAAAKTFTIYLPIPIRWARSCRPRSRDTAGCPTPSRPPKRRPRPVPRR